MAKMLVEIFLEPTSERLVNVVISKAWAFRVRLEMYNMEWGWHGNERVAFLTDLDVSLVSDKKVLLGLVGDILRDGEMLLHVDPVPIENSIAAKFVREELKSMPKILSDFVYLEASLPNHVNFIFPSTFLKLPGFILDECGLEELCCTCVCGHCSGSCAQ